MFFAKKWNSIVELFCGSAGGTFGELNFAVFYFFNIFSGMKSFPVPA